ncbi:MAG: hypothetical protein E6898_09475 [Corynebacterium sp.]|uniref:hypothetical protein n=1 Tax=unclassified Corynebacterium TaxID=2624378 RepID=UPI000B1C94E3|nr:MULTISPECIES: hypothetical protein [unclassified Corynebacterium]MDU1462957.1 hypothetical protein [Corynebacterium sp.]
MTSLDSATYVVPDHGFGVIHNLPVGDVSPEVFSELLESTAAEGGYFSAELGPRTAQEGFAVRIDDSLVGHLSAADSQAYALFDWILSAGLHPHATAHVSMTDASGEEWPTLNLLLPAPHLCIPANNPPAQRWTMLPGETTATMTEFSKDVTGFPQTDEHYLVTLRTRGFLRQKAVDVYVNSTFLGSLPRDAAREIAPAVLDCTKSGRLAIAHGYFHYNADDRPALTIYAHNAANKHHAGLVLGIVAGGAAIMSAATAARAQAAPAVPGGTTAGATTAGASATSGFSVTSAAGAVGASGAVTSNLLAAAGVAVLVGGGATVATNLLSDDEALSDSNAPSTAPAPEGNHSSHFDGNGPKRPAHPATPRIHDAGPTSDTSPQPPLADAPSSPTPHHHTYPSQTTKKPSATHSPHADHSQTHAPASDNRRGHHSEPRDSHHGDNSHAISRAASAAAAAAGAAADNVDSARTSAPAPAPSRTTPASTPSSSSALAPQVAAKASTATSSSSQSAEPSQTTESTKSTTSAEPSSAASSPAEPSDLPTSSTSTSEKTTSEKTTAETTTAASTEKQTTEPSSSATSSATSEPTSEPTQAADPSTPTSASSTSTSAQPEPESSKPASSEPKPSESTAPTTTSPLLTSESEPEPAPDTTIPGSELEPTPEPEEPGRPEEPEEPTTPPKVIVIVAEN